MTDFCNVGRHCQHPECNLRDYLPFKCDACHKIFCLQHHKYGHHNCRAGIQSLKGRTHQTAPCPLCLQKVTAPVCANEDKDKMFYEHWKSCPVALGVRVSAHKHKHETIKKPKRNKCTQCKKKIKNHMKFKCRDCGDIFCIQHRNPLDHCCSAPCSRVNRLTRESRLLKKQNITAVR